MGQSILELGYHYPSEYGDEKHLPMIVMNGLLGEFAHSKLFTNVRENAGLALYYFQVSLIYLVDS